MRRRIFQVHWSLHGAWRRHEVPRRAAPLPVEVLLVFCGSNGVPGGKSVGSATAARISLSYFELEKAVEMRWL